MILQSIAPEARSSATDYVADVADVKKTEVRQGPMPCLADALFGRCPVWPMPCLADAPASQKNAGTVYHCRLPPSADPLRGEH
ncbi:hypothetical protein QUB19_11735 [Microcoleus sp. B4-C5]|uniref:hypothetical protein n=1 Tax=unclassified Microcoleus TaxID=2642155 RepID=UPI002FD5A64A